jgi:CheY-like chemotaxis protein
MDRVKKILWVDDEIDLLKPHVLFLEKRGYSVLTATNGDDAVRIVSETSPDVVLLDQTMAGMDGLQTLERIKDRNASLPVVMITKSEEEDLMNTAIGRRIDDFLIKPVKPSQILLVLKRILEGRTILESQQIQDYVSFGSRMRMDLQVELDWQEWIDIAVELARWDLELDALRDESLMKTHDDLRSSANARFGDYIAENYLEWLNSEDRPGLSVDVFSKSVFELLRKREKVFLLVLDSMRLDHWLNIQPILEQDFHITDDYYYSILPSATPYSRNAIFSGLFPSELARHYPTLWEEMDRTEQSKNRYEKELLEKQQRSLNITLNPPAKYMKIYEKDEAASVRRQIESGLPNSFVALVFNFVDILAHGRSESEILQEIAPDDSAFRSLTRSWFMHSELLETIRAMGRQGAKVIITTDHGSILAKRATLARGNRDTSTNLRYKFGSNLGCDEKEAIHVRKPSEYNLPAEGPSKEYIIAKEDYYFVYPTRFRSYEKRYKGSFQHGGVSLEEMVLPCATLEPRK